MSLIRSILYYKDAGFTLIIDFGTHRVKFTGLTGPELSAKNAEYGLWEEPP